MCNNIKRELELKEISINKFSEMIGLSYANTHALVNRKDLSTTPLGTIIKVADVLKIDIVTLYK